TAGGGAGGGLNSVGAVNAALQSGQNVALPAKSSAIVTGSWQLGQNTRMTVNSFLDTLRTPWANTPTGPWRLIHLRSDRRAPGRRPARANEPPAAPRRTGRAPARAGPRSRR